MQTYQNVKTKNDPPEHVKEKHNMHGHTHVNVTPHIRQHVMNELQEDEDLKDWWSRCRELVDIEYECLKNNKHKF